MTVSVAATSHRELDDARARHWEDPAGARDVARRVQRLAHADGELACRALALSGLITLNHGDLPAALALAAQAERRAAEGAAARCEVASLKALLAFFSGSYTEALQQADAAVAIADAADDLTLQVFARRMACPVFGNLGVPDLGERFADALELSILDGDPWQEALSRNDVACWHHEEGRVAEAEDELARGLELAAPLERNRFLVGVLHATRADIRLLASRPVEALADAEEALAALIEHGEPNPYIFGVTVRAQVQALAALDRLDDARHASERALERLGDQVPHTRSLVLGAIAAALREAGHVEDAYDALSRSVELEREGLRQLAELRVDLERTMLEAAALADQNAQLEALVRELNAAHSELEGLKEQFREQADRDWLTGLHNRRFLARELDRAEPAFSLAVFDLDHFKHVNDEHGHDAGDKVLVRVASLLMSVVRHSDVVARTGGEEFVVLMAHTDLAAAAACCERALAAIRSESWEDIAPGLTVTASVGIAGAGEAERFDDVAALADTRLYAAKRAGRDRVVAQPL